MKGSGAIGGATAGGGSTGGGGDSSGGGDSGGAGAATTGGGGGGAPVGGAGGPSHWTGPELSTFWKQMPTGHGMLPHSTVTEKHTHCSAYLIDVAYIVLRLRALLICTLLSFAISPWWVPGGRGFKFSSSVLVLARPSIHAAATAAMSSSGCHPVFGMLPMSLLL